MNPSAAPSFMTGLLDPQAYPHPAEPLRLLETHISWVLLAGAYAYKIKKPLSLGFLDYSTLEKRAFYCHEELRLNRRLAPHLYLEVVVISGTVENPRIGQEGPPLEYAVKMTAFPQEALANRAVSEGRLEKQHIDILAREVAAFHQRIEQAPTDSPFGTPDKVMEPMRANFAVLSQAPLDALRLTQVTRVTEWSEHFMQTHQQEFARRKAQGLIRECHGDMHLGNIILDNGSLTIFDGIEFNESLRWIDVMNDVAFCTMDLHHRGRSDFAHRFLNAYVQETGDYEGLNVIRIYLVYRAMVRAKVAWIRLEQEQAEGTVEPELYKESETYLDLADQFTATSSPHLFITHGLSGSGKTAFTQQLVDSLGAIRLRSDVERKRLAGLSWHSPNNTANQKGIYTPSVTDRTYEVLGQQAEWLLKAGFHVIVDATFLQRNKREQFKHLADRLGVSFHILSFHAGPDTLRKRITARRAEAHDASDATTEVLDRQLKNQDSLEPQELCLTIKIDTDTQHSEDLLAQVQKVLAS